MLKELRLDLKRLANPQKAKILQGFFKTRTGQYGAGDVFLGITSVKSRPLVKQYKDLSLGEISELLRSKIHEERQMALFILVYQYEHGDSLDKQKIYRLYLRSTRFINNWDLVDLSTPKIVGPHLQNRPRAILYKLVKSKNLWERRIAILSTFYFIRQNDFKDTLSLSRLLLKDEHDLIHKAVGWMLREVGKRNELKLCQFLDRYAAVMPRTMLRYAIEKFPSNKRYYCLSLK